MHGWERTQICLLRGGFLSLRSASNFHVSCECFGPGWTGVLSPLVSRRPLTSFASWWHGRRPRLDNGEEPPCNDSHAERCHVCWRSQWPGRRSRGHPLERRPCSAFRSTPGARKGGLEARVDLDRRHPSVLQPVDGIWWLFDRLQGLPQGCGPPPVLHFGGKRGWCVLKSVGDITHGQVWVEVDHFRDVGDVAGVGKDHDYSGDTMMVLRWVALSELLSPSVNDSRSLPLASLPLDADRDRRMVQMWRERHVRRLLRPRRNWWPRTLHRRTEFLQRTSTAGCPCSFSSGCGPLAQRFRNRRAHQILRKPAGARVWVQLATCALCAYGVAGFVWKIA